VPYFHVVFTLPAAIADLAYHNKAVIYDLLFKASSEALLTIAADPKHLGARIGVTAVLHSWGSAMTHHPHVHMIVPGSLDGSSWVRCRPGFLLCYVSTGRHPKPFTRPVAPCVRQRGMRAGTIRQIPTTRPAASRRDRSAPAPTASLT
jgi:Putative transposase